MFGARRNNAPSYGGWVGAWLATLSCLAALWFAPEAAAAVSPAPLFTDRAVLQQGKPVPVWGLAEPGEKVTVTYQSPKETRSASAIAGEDGRWQVTLDALPASSEPATLTFKGRNSVERNDILVGEVWLAAGQSNMDTALFWTKAGKEIAATVDYPGIRYFKVGTVSKDTPQTGLGNKQWALCTAGKAGGFTELGYYFAKELHRTLGVPVGIINSSWGGTAVEAWIDPDSLNADPAGAEVKKRWAESLAAFPAKMAKFEETLTSWNAEKLSAETSGEEFKKQKPQAPGGGPGSQQTPTGLYNAMVHPLIPYGIRGIIWYQGESNAGRSAEYRTLFPSLINGWRRIFAQGDVPFYWVQLPGYNIPEKDADWGGIREAQTRALVLPETGQAVTVDIGDPKEIHPANKEEVARRLSLIALRRTYGKTETVDSGPVMDNVEFLDDGSVRVRFAFCEGGLQSGEGEIPGFEIAGEDGIFRKAEAGIESGGLSVLVLSPDIPVPQAVRYALRNNPGKLTLSNRAGLPATPFQATRSQP